MKKYISVLWAEEQAKKPYVPRIKFIGTIILTVFWVLLSLFTYPCTGVEATAPTREEICGVYEVALHDYYGMHKGTMTIRIKDANYHTATFSKGFPEFSYCHYSSIDVNKGRVVMRYSNSPAGALWFYLLRNGNNIIVSRPRATFKKPDGSTDYIEMTGKKISELPEQGAPAAKKQSKNTVTQKKQNPANSGAGQQKNKAVQSKRDTEKQESTVKKGRTYQQDDEDFDQDDLPTTDAGKAAAAIGISLGGAMLGGAAGAASGGGASGSAAGGSGNGFGSRSYSSNKDYYGPDEGGYGPDEGGYGPDEGGYGPDEGGYGPDEGGYGPDEGSGNDYEDSGDGGEGSGDGGEGSGDGGEGSGDDGEGSGDEGEESGDDGEESGDEGEESGDEGEDSGDEGEDSGDEGEDSGDEGEDSGDDGEGSGDEDEGSGDDGEDSGDEGEDFGDEDEGSGNEGEGSGDDDEGSGNEGEGSGDEDEGSGDDGEGSGDDGEESGDEGEGSGDDDEGSGDEDEGSGNEGEGSGDDSDESATDSGDVSGDAEQSESSDTAGDESAKDSVDMDTPPDNMSVDDDGNIHVTTGAGDEMVYTRNEDGTYQAPTQTKSGDDLAYTDENGVRHVVGERTLSQEDVLGEARWYKGEEEQMRAERAAEDAHQQALRDLEAEKDRVWLDKQREINNQKSWLTKELEEEKEWKEKNYNRLQHVEKMRDKYAQGDESLSEDELKRVMKNTRLKKDQAIHMKEGGEYEQEASEWDNKVITAQGTKFVVDQTVNAYGMLSHDPVLPKAYNAASNYAETMTDAYVNGKDMKKAFVKATADTTIDLVVDKGESGGFKAAVLSNTLGSGFKQMNDNLYNGRKLTDGVSGALVHGSVTGLVSGGANKLIQVSKGTVLDTKIADIGPNTRLDFWNNPKVGNVDANVPTGKVHTDVETDGMRQTSVAERRMGEGSLKPNTPDVQTGKTNIPETPSGKPNIPETPSGKPNVDTPSAKPNVPETPSGKPNVPETPSSKPNVPETPSGKPNIPGTPSGKPNVSETPSGKVKEDADSGTTDQRPVGDGNTGSTNKPKPGGTESKNQSSASDAAAKAQANEDWQGSVAMNKVRKLHKISEKMAAMEKANPKGYQKDPEYQKLSEQFDSQAREVRENKLAIDRMNLLQGKTGTDLRSRYNKSDIAYEQEVLRNRNESLAEEYGLNPDQIGDLNVSSNDLAKKLAGGKAGHDTDTSPYVKVNTGDGKNAKVDFTQIDGDHHLARAIYKTEYGRYPQTAAEYDEALRLKQLRDFTNVSTRPSDTHESYRNPDAYVGSGQGDVNKVLHPEINGTPEKGTGVYNEMTAIHKQKVPLERYHQQSAEAQELRQKLNTDKNLSAAEKTEIGKKIQHLESQSASNHYESVRTTAKEYNVINNINNVNMKNGLKDGLSKEARQIGEWANKVARGEMSAGQYQKLVTQKFGSEENALKIVAKGFRTTNL